MMRRSSTRDLSRPAVGACLAMAAAATLLISATPGLLPPGLHPRPLELASAQTQLLVDTPRSAVLDLGRGASEFAGMTNRALLIGNVMTSPSVLDYIGRRAGIAPQAIRVQAPLTPDFPRPLAAAGQGAAASDLLRATGEYRLNVQTDPTVPVLKVFVEAPDARSAARLANASAEGLRAYLDDYAAAQGTPASDRVRLVQLGRAHGVLVSHGVRLQIAVLTFLLVFLLTASVAAGLRRRRSRRRVARPQDGRPPAPARRAAPDTDAATFAAERPGVPADGGDAAASAARRAGLAVG